MRSIGSFLCLLLLLLLGAQPSAQAQSSIGVVSASEGQGSVRRGAQTLKLKAGLIIVEGDEIRTEANGAVTVQTNGRDQIELGNSTSLSVATENRLVGAEIKAKLLSGIVRSAIDTRAQSIEVITANADVNADSGTYDTSYYTGILRPGFGACAQFTEVAALSDAAVVTSIVSHSAAPTTVPAGYATVVACDTSPLSPAPLMVTGVRTLNRRNTTTSAGIAGILTYFFGPGSGVGELQAVSGTVISPQF